MQMQIGHSLIHLFSVHSELSGCRILCQLSSSEFCSIFIGFFFCSQVSVSTFIETTRQQIIIIAATRGAQNTGGDHTRIAHVFPSVVCTCSLLSCSCAIPQTHTRKNKIERNENSEAESLSVSSVRVILARACTQLTDLSGTNDKLSPTGKSLLATLISSPTSSVISAVLPSYLVVTH